MLKALIKKQLQEVFNQVFARKGRNGKKASAKGRLILLIVLAVYLAGTFGVMLFSLADALYEAELGWLYYLVLSGAAILFGTFGSVFSTYSTLYLAKDNDLLLSMPIPVGHVILSRLLSVYIMGLIYSGLLSLPGVAAGLIAGGFRVSALVGGLVLILLISLIVLALSCLLGWVVAKLSLRLKNKSWLTALIAVAFLGLYYFFYFRIMNHISEILDSMILLGGRIEASARPLWLFGAIGEGNWLGMLIWTAAVLLLLALVWVTLKRSFLSIATASADRKTVRRREELRRSSVSAALLRKEWLRFTSSSTYMLNCGLGLVMLLGLGVWLLIQGRELAAKVSGVFGAYPDMLPVIGCGLCCVLAGMVDVSAPSVSLEGRTLWQLQSLPLPAWKILRAKLELHLLLAAFPVLFCAVSVLFAIPEATLAQKLLILAVTVLAAVFFALLGLCLGLKMPNLDWTNEIVPIKQSMPVLFTILAGLGLGGLLTGLYFFFGCLLGAVGWLGIFSLLLLAADAALFLWLRGPGSRRFEALN